MNLKKIGNVITSKSVGTGPSSYENRIYRPAVLQRLRNIALDCMCDKYVFPKSYFWNLLTPWSRVQLDNLTGLQVVKYPPHFMEPEGSLPHSQVPAICPYSEPDQSNSCPPHPTPWRSILILSSYLRLGLPSGHFPSGFPTNTLYIPLLSPTRTIRPVRLISLDFITRKLLAEECRSLSSLIFLSHFSNILSSYNFLTDFRCRYLV